MGDAGRHQTLVGQDLLRGVGPYTAARTLPLASVLTVCQHECQTHPRTDQEQSTPDHHKGAHINNTRGLLEHRARVISETAPQSTPTQPTNPGHLLHTTTTAREEDEALQPNTQKQIHRRSQDEKTKKRAPNQRPGEIPRTRTQRNGGKPLQRARQK